ncbi:MAG: hypothetical protein ABF991_03605 [Liquorilactobacillus hordei]|uniref:hypothetical protein n=1 Tax=Liquorilactobacillus hordei TaxID=468911 RepID=UPI0039ED7036
MDCVDPNALERQKKFNIITKLGYEWSNDYQLFLTPNYNSLPPIDDRQALCLAGRILQMGFVEEMKK